MKHESNHKERHIHFAAKLILSYQGNEPFNLYLKKYFSANKKHGSRDRKQITALCYQYFRPGNGLVVPMTTEEKILFGHELIAGITPLELKLEKVASYFNACAIFPFNHELSAQVNTNIFNRSFLVQPILFARIRPGKQIDVIRKLRKKEFSFKQLSDSCLSFENTTGLEEALKINEEIVIQDLNSQNCSLFFEKMDLKGTSNPAIWDACAASGGKSILATDQLKNIQLTVSDKRHKILLNLEKRFGQAGINNYNSFQADLSMPVKSLQDNSFDIIIADVPCSGSGTWSRTPEQLHFFRQEQIREYAGLQRKIVSNIIPKLKKGGYLLYLTCSVFRKENEDNVQFFCEEYSLKVVHQQYLAGYDQQADTLFGALLQY